MTDHFTHPSTEKKAIGEECIRQILHANTIFGLSYLKIFVFLDASPTSSISTFNCGFHNIYSRSHTKFGTDRFSRYDVYWIQTYKQTYKINLYIDIPFPKQNHFKFILSKEFHEEECEIRLPEWFHVFDTRYGWV